MIERSHEKARPTLPRASDLASPVTDGKPTDARGSHGHFTAGNRSALGARFKATLRKSLGNKASDGDVLTVYRDAQRVFAHTIRSLPSDAAPVRTLVVLHARHVALHGFFTAKAETAGLETELGQKLLVIADRQSQRAERVLVTALDVARVCASRRPDDPNAPPIGFLPAVGS